MKSKGKELDVDFISGQGPLTKEEQQKISEYIKTQNKSKQRRKLVQLKQCNKKKRLLNEYKHKDFDILGVASDGKKGAWVEAVQKNRLTWQNVGYLRGDKNKAGLIYGVSYHPTNILIDRSGLIIAKDLSGDASRKKLNNIFK